MNEQDADKRPLVVLGRSISHENSACIIKDGHILAAIAAERLTRKKYDHDHNDRAIRYCLTAAGLKLDDVDVIVQNNPKHYFLSGNESNLIRNDDPRVWTISHHLAHAWAAFGCSSFNRAVVVVIDGRGNFVPPEGDIVLSPNGSAKPSFFCCGNNLSIEVESIYLADGVSMELLYRRRSRGLPTSIGSAFSRRPGLYPGEYSGYYQYAGLGALYEQASYGIFGSSLDGGKVMGLAAFAEPSAQQVEKIIRFDSAEGTYQLKAEWLHDFRGPLSIKDSFDQAAVVASNVQRALEQGVESVMQLAKNLSGESHLCYSGGVALNCLANEVVLSKKLFNNVFIQPACNDGGASVGCAYYGTACILRRALPHVRYVDFHGRTYSEKEVVDAMHRWRKSIVVHRVGNPEKVACELLCSRQVVGWYQGGSELGPRALGHRSILSLPHPSSVKDRINSVIKRRESYRPFAPIVPVEDASRYFEVDGESPYMLRVVNVRRDYRDRLAAVTHIDGTARVQTVCREDNPSIHELLCLVGQETGMSVLLNTSFNCSGFPMVETPYDAIETFVSSGLDSLMMNDWLVRKRVDTPVESAHQERQFRWQLLPGTEIHVLYSPRAEAWLQRGPWRKAISPEHASLLATMCQYETVDDQLQRAESPQVFRLLLLNLAQEGWLYSEATDTQATM